MRLNADFARIFFFLIIFSVSAVCYGQTCTPSSTAAGSLDSCFGTGGRVTTQISSGVDVGRGVAVQPNGKIVVAGTANLNGTSDFAVVRYNADGSLDTSFSGDGRVTIDFGGRDDEARSVGIQTDGKIVIAGTSSNDFAVARLNTNGTLDTSFNGDGGVLTDIGASTFDTGKSLAIQPNGRIVVVGESRAAAGVPSVVVVRYNTTGALDGSFDGDGKAFIGSLTIGNAVAIQTDGKILAAGSNRKLSVARLFANGAPDTFFGINGIASFSAANLNDEAFALFVQSNGAILAAGSSQTSQFGAVCAPLVRFGMSGAVEASIVNCNENPAGMTIFAITVQPDGKIVTAGVGGLFPAVAFQIVRYTSSLLIDGTFNGNGVLRIGFTNGNSQENPTAYAVTIGRDNKIVAAGFTKESVSATSGRFAAVRVMSGLAEPPAALFDFDGDGRSDISVFRPSTNNWYSLQSSTLQVSVQQFGLAGDTPTPADFDGDGITDLGIFRPSSGDWWIKSSISGGFSTVHWGQSGDIPRPSDFDGDGKADFIVYRPSDSVWYRLGSTGTVSIMGFGITGDKPLAGDFDGDGRSDVAIFRPATGDWWYQSSINNAQIAVHWGISTDTPVAADYDGDGKTDFGVYRDGTWYILNSGNGSSTIVNFGLSNDKPVAADYDGDGRSDIAVFRPSTGTWYLLQSTAGYGTVQFGISTDIALPNAFVP